MATELEIKQVYNLLAINYPAHAAKLTPDDMQQPARLVGATPGRPSRRGAESRRAPAHGSIAMVPGRCGVAPAGGRDHRTSRAGGNRSLGDVTAAMASARYYRYADGFHEFPSLPIRLRSEVVDAMGWGNLCGSEDGTADRARFLQGYEAVAKRMQDERAKLPIVRELAARLAAGRNLQIGG